MRKSVVKLNKLIVILLTICIFILTNQLSVLAKKDIQQEILKYIEGIINWKKTSLNISTDEPMFNSLFLKNAGDTSGDWYPFGMGRIGYNDEYDKYLAVIHDVVEEKYKNENKLSHSKATEWHRISLAILSSGGDPTKAGKDKNGEIINLIADGTYNRGKTKPLGTQGLNGWIWGLITLDSMRYSVPEDAYDTRQSIIKEILKAQLSNGGFSLNSPEPDADMTAMAIQALAPYYNSEENYTYTSSWNEKITRTVREVVDEAVKRLSEMQLNSGDFESMGAPNAESTAQVIVALTALGIDPLTDKRFIKNENNVLQGIMNYMMDDGGFIHSKSYDSENPSSLPDQSNTMASEQILYSLVSLYRFQENHRTLYDFREEMSEELKEVINSIKQSIDIIPDKVKESDTDFIKDIFKDYLTIPIEERSYVFNYYMLANAMEKLEIENTSEHLANHMDINTEGTGSTISLYDEDRNNKFDGIFSQKDVSKALAIPDEITTEYYVDVISLIDKLESSTNKNEYSDLLDKLLLQKDLINQIEKDIDSLNEDIVKQLYPFDKIGIKDRKKVQRIIERYNDLSPYDQQSVQSFTDVERAEVQINNMIRSVVIFVVLVFVIGILTIYYLRRIYKRRQQKMKSKMMLEEE